MTARESDAELRDLLAPLLRRRTRFVEAEQPADSLLATRFGGRPAGLVGEAWPSCTCGAALQFVGQFSGHDAPLFASWFQLATVFYCWQCKDGDAQTFQGRERPWTGFCVRAYPTSDEDDHAVLVYADWLQARGDPNGELIAFAHALERTRDPHERAARQLAIAELMRRHPKLPAPPPWREQPATDREELALIPLPGGDLVLLDEHFVRPVRELSMADWITLRQVHPAVRAMFDRRDYDRQLALRLEDLALELIGDPPGLGRERRPPTRRNRGTALGGWPDWRSGSDDTPRCPRCGWPLELFVQLACDVAPGWSQGDEALCIFLCPAHRDHFALRIPS